MVRFKTSFLVLILFFSVSCQAEQENEVTVEYREFPEINGRDLNKREKVGPAEFVDINLIIIIPARLRSSRLSKKLLRIIHGKPMIQRVAENAKNLGFKNVIVATDSNEIFNLCKRTKIKVIMSIKKHESGTDRVYEAY